MRLLIISATPHYRRRQDVVGWGATVREIDYLAELFDEVVHVAVLHPGAAPDSALPYRSSRVSLVPVPPAGGPRIGDKLGIAAVMPSYLRVIVRELAAADAVHVRCPANISAIALGVLAATRHPRRRWIKYAGAWRGYDGEPRSYRIQRAWLERGIRGAHVTVNGRWERMPSYIHTFFNPSLTDDELADGRRIAASKRLPTTPRILFVGGLSVAKGAGTTVEVLQELSAGGVEATLTLVGDGPERESIERRALELGLRERVVMRGWRARESLAGEYAAAHFVLLPSLAEGWPKVLSEGMAYGAVPVASDVGSIPSELSALRVGRCAQAGDAHGFAEAIASYASAPDGWAAESARAVAAAERFGYSAYLRDVARLLDL
jgi:glycosyltransferase involved in cell wall biosynthesis